MVPAEIAGADVSSSAWPDTATGTARPSSTSRRSAIRVATLLIVIGLIVPDWSYAQSEPCQPYLITRARLTEILRQNIGQAPLSNPQVSTHPNSACEIRLKATVNPANIRVVGCTKPMHRANSLGLMDINIRLPVGSVTLRVEPVNIEAEIGRHCGAHYPISAARVVEGGVLVEFRRP